MRRFGGSGGAHSRCRPPSHAVAVGTRQEKEQEGCQVKNTPHVLVFWAFPRPHAALSMW